MKLDAPLVLSPEVEIVPVRDLAPHIRAGLSAPGDDYALTRLRSRAPSRIIDQDSAALLTLFRTPTRLVDAVLAFADQHERDPEVTLEQAYPLLFKLWETRLLTASDSVATNEIESMLQVGSTVGDVRLLRCIQALEDTEVFLGCNAAGAYVAVKFCHPGHTHVMQAIKHEARMMRRIRGQRAPMVLGQTPIDGGLALMSEWISGLDIANAAEGIRGRREPRHEEHLLALCIEVVNAFAEVHASGVLHGDVHPRNILLEPSGRVRLIDFGLAQDIEQQAESSGARGGVAFYFDPQLAEALLRNKHAPLTAAGEQYSVASLLYHLWTGAHYVDWKLERNEMLHQIIAEEPMPFATRRIPPWSALEQTLRRALHKRPECRFESMEAFAQALRELLPAAQMRTQQAMERGNEHAYEEDVLQRVLSRYEIGAAGLHEGLVNAPFASINYGAAGIAYALYRIAQRRGDAHLLALADIWIQKAYALSSHEQAFHNPDLGVEPQVTGEVSLFHSLSGLHCVRALVSMAFGDRNGSHLAMHAFVAHSQRPCESADATLGIASLLIGCAELVEAFPIEWHSSLEMIRSRGAELADELFQMLASSTIDTSTSMPSLGIAHGWAGILFALLRWSRATKAEPQSIIAEKLHELASLAEPHGGGLWWPVHNATRPPRFMDSWCNGTAGYALLFALAYDVLHEAYFAELVQHAAECAWVTDTRLGSLCCGLAGIGYACLAAYRVTGSQRWLERARTVTRRAAVDTSEHFFLDSLYKGAVGVAVLTEDLKHPLTAAMPLFESIIHDWGKE
ncbi:lanthionine synthetase LanC family protein [Dictyobacter kobayashii]|uniref:Protein kinase domain-containing protein n=1 Tax=Dictyobacter kobayashii TaxID=2014872 RepID=A0A402AQ44_9CHLR|nr:lanthionine synthetase LanC family protein [Dictyobacter kobayashii]GCE21155.1 hypothetical protein KDK_49550 [Dictyobacter kobayashii]